MNTLLCDIEGRKSCLFRYKHTHAHTVSSLSFPSPTGPDNYMDDRECCKDFTERWVLSFVLKVARAGDITNCRWKRVPDGRRLTAERAMSIRLEASCVYNIDLEADCTVSQHVYSTLSYVRLFTRLLFHLGNPSVYTSPSDLFSWAHLHVVGMLRFFFFLT